MVLPPTVQTPAGLRSMPMSKKTRPVSAEVTAAKTALDAARATRRADIKKMRDERGAARKVADDARTAKKAARMAARAKSTAPRSNTSVMGRVKSQKTAPTTGIQNTGPENVGSRPVPLARPQMPGYKKGGTVRCKTY